MLLAYFRCRLCLEYLLILTVRASSEVSPILSQLNKIRPDQTSTQYVISKQNGISEHSSIINQKAFIPNFFNNFGIFQNNRLLKKSLELINKHGFPQNMESAGHDVSQLDATNVPDISSPRSDLSNYSKKKLELCTCQCEDYNCKVTKRLKLTDVISIRNKPGPKENKFSWFKMKDNENKERDDFDHEEKRRCNNEGTDVFHTITSYCNEILGKEKLPAIGNKKPVVEMAETTNGGVTNEIKLIEENLNSETTVTNGLYNEAIYSSTLQYSQYPAFTERLEKEIPYLEPISLCNFYDEIKRICYLTKQLGDTAVFTVKIARITKNGSKFQIVWKKSLKSFSDNNQILETLEPATLFKNIHKLDHGRELKIRPVTDVDIHYNTFKAILKQSDGDEDNSVFIVLGDIAFSINIRPFDMGRVYVNEVTTVDIDHYMVLDYSSSLSFFWGIEESFIGDVAPLNKNMVVKRQGKSILITHVEDDTSQIIVCIARTTEGEFHAKRRFLFHKPVTP